MFGSCCDDIVMMNFNIIGSLDLEQINSQINITKIDMPTGGLIGKGSDFEFGLTEP